jgi:prolyl 4-hydroxylase
VLGSSRQRDLYDAFMVGCERAAAAVGRADVAADHDETCLRQENWRMQRNMYQPRSVVNYTETGFLKVKAPEALFRELVAFWETNKNEWVEEWPGKLSTYHNSWEAPTRIVRIENGTLVGGGNGLVRRIGDAVRPVLEAWTGMKLARASAYGVRAYRNGSILAPHLDRLPLVVSAIVNVAQDSVEEPWPLELYDHEGVAHNVTVEPGDMVLYESHSVIHGRPFPLRGLSFASVCEFHPFQDDCPALVVMGLYGLSHNRVSCVTFC